MKRLVYIFFGILLAIIIGTTFFTGDGDLSMKTMSNNIMENVSEEVNGILK